MPFEANEFFQNSLTGFKKAISNQFFCDVNSFNCDNNSIIKYTFKESLIFKSPFKTCSFGNGTVISIEDKYNCLIEKIASEFSNISSKDLLFGKNLFKLNNLLLSEGLYLKGNLIRYLLKSMDVKLNNPPKTGSLKWFYKDDFEKLYLQKGFLNALAYDYSDTLAVGIVKDEKIIALAGCDNNLSSNFRQIGIDVLPEFYNLGFGKYLVSLLSLKILSDGYIPYYTTWSANLPSTKLALSCGYLPVCFENHAIKI
ncbi:MAG: hypothetical protein RR640_01745 [Oscillospiraceae bacterium]